MKTQGTVTENTKSRPKFQTSPFQPKPSLLLDVLPAGELKSSVKTPSVKSNESPEYMLQRLLLTAETSAQRLARSRMKWQLSALLALMMFVPTLIIAARLYIENGAAGARQHRLQAGNQSLKEQLNSTHIQIAGLKGELDTLLTRNLELARLAAPPAATKHRPAPQTIPPTAQKTTPKPPTIAEQSFDSGRVEAMRKGTYPNGATKNELTAVLGQPDRIYKSRNYEQLVYFGRKPGRFWFIGNWLVQTSN